MLFLCSCCALVLPYSEARVVNVSPVGLQLIHAEMGCGPTKKEGVEQLPIVSFLPRIGSFWFIYFWNLVGCDRQAHSSNPKRCSHRLEGCPPLPSTYREHG